MTGRPVSFVVPVLLQYITIIILNEIDSAKLSYFLFLRSSCMIVRPLILRIALLIALEWWDGRGVTEDSLVAYFAYPRRTPSSATTVES